ncbi:MAG: HAMP domain-containing sensor histidine kinase [Bacteroidota bacterium]
MKSRNAILVFGALAIGLVLGIFIFQISALPNLRLQIRSGLHNSMQTIADDAARGLDQTYTQTITRGASVLQHSIAPDAFSEENLLSLRANLLLIASTELISNSWIVVFPDRRKRRYRAYEYKQPNRYRGNLSKLGDWRPDTDLGVTIEQELRRLTEPYLTVDSFATEYWKSAVDSNLIFGYDMAFTDAVLTGVPWFHPKTDSLLGFIFNQTNEWYLENVLVRDYFNDTFWEGEDEREGIKRKYLQLGVLDLRGSRVVYNSVAYGQRDFEHTSSLADIGSWLSKYRIGLRFRDSSVDEVADSIYDRNFYLIIALFVVLILVLILLFRAAARMVKLSRLKTEFVANVSHEIKTPLASIKLASDTLKLGRAQNPEQSSKVVSILGKETERLQYLIRTLLDFSQLEAGKKKYQKQVLPIPQWWNSVKRFFRENVGAVLEIEENEIPDQSLEIDAQALEQVFTILIDNARKYAPEGNRIVLRGSTERRGFRIDVQDFGIGISRENQAIIFEKFVRLGNTDIHNVKGHGIGLSMARAILKNHKGQINVESKIGSGSTFYLILPFTKSSTP